MAPAPAAPPPATRLHGAITRLHQRATAPTDVAGLLAFRVLFGLLVAGAAVRFLARGWVTDLLSPGRFHFTWAGFDWVRPWPAPFMHVHLAVLAGLGLALAAGRRPRVAAALYAVGLTYVELIDKAHYLNHYYLVSLLAALLALLPVGRLALAPRPGRATHLPAWVTWALRAQIAIVYLHAGLAKLNADWLLRAQPLRIWLRASDLPLVAPWLEPPAVAFAFSWAGAVFDLAVVPLLLVRRTRRVAFAAVVVFHVLTACLFPIGLFPWMMIAGATLFLAPDWPRRWLPARTPVRIAPPTAPGRGLVPALIAAHLAVQAALPLRQHLSPGASAWTYDGFNFAWNVMVAEKTGGVVFTVTDPACGRRARLTAEDALTAGQRLAMAQDPAMIRAFARHLAAAEAAHGHAHVHVHADAVAALNGHPARRLLPADEDLAAPIASSPR